MKWEYTVTPASPVRRFACTSDRDEFHDLIGDVATSAWYMTPNAGVKANDRQAFELLQYTVDGQERKIRRSERKTGQTYTVNLGDDVMRASKPIKIAHTYRTVAPKASHNLFLAVAQPTRGITVTLDYTDTDIDQMRVSELVSSAARPRTAVMPKEVAARVVTVEVPGWLLPPAQFTCVWSLASERLPAEPTAA